MNSVFRFLYCCCCWWWWWVAVAGQRYAERRVIPADSAPSSAGDYDYYAFEEEGDVYKWLVEEFPHPRNGSRFCNRLRPSNVCDPDMILTREHADALDESIRELFKKTPCICPSCEDGGGIVVGVALLKHIYQPYNSHPVRTIKAFAESLRKQWQLGKCDNDILIVVATTDRLSYTDVGASAASLLPAEEAHRLFVANRAQFTAGDFYGGLRDIVAGYREEAGYRIGAAAGSDSPPGLASGLAVGGGIVLFGLLLLAAVLVYRRYKKKRQEVDRFRGDETDCHPPPEKDIPLLFDEPKGRGEPYHKEEDDIADTSFQDREKDETRTARHVVITDI